LEHDQERSGRREAQGYQKRRLAVGVGVAVVLGALLAPFPPASRLVDSLTDVSHVPLFAAVALGAAHWLLRRGVRSGAALVLAWMAAVGLGLAIEVLQELVGREASKADLWADAAGAAAGVMIAAARFPVGERRRRGWWWTAAAAAALAGSVWPALRLGDVARQRLRPARLGTFEDGLELDRWSFDGSRAVRSPDHATQGRYSLRVELRRGRYPGAGLTSPPPDWSAYAAVRCDLYLEGDAPLDLRVKVEDEEHNGQFSDRFQRVVRLAPGASRVEIALADVAAGPRGRRLDLSRVAQLRFFAVDLDAPRVLFLDDLRLVESH
jgi:VanZ family protein